MTAHLDSLGLATEKAASRARSQSRGRSLRRPLSEAPGDDAMDVDLTPKERLRSRTREPSTNRRDDGVTNETARSMADRLQKLGQVKRNRMARAGEADRHVGVTMPKHLFAGKRGMGKNQRR